MPKSIVDKFSEYGVSLRKEGGVYISEALSREIGLKVDGEQVELIYKEAIKTYPATESTYDHLAMLFRDGVFDFSAYDEYGESYIEINNWCYTWYAGSPFETGTFHAMDTRLYHDEYIEEGDVSYDYPIDIKKVLEVIFDRHKEWEFIVFYFSNQRIPVLNPHLFPNIPYLPF